MTLTYAMCHTVGDVSRFRLAQVKLPVLLLAARSFSLTGIWAAEACSELILSIVAFGMLRRLQAEPDPPLYHEHVR